MLLLLLCISPSQKLRGFKFIFCSDTTKSYVAAATAVVVVVVVVVVVMNLSEPEMGVFSGPVYLFLPSGRRLGPV